MAMGAATGLLLSRVQSPAPNAQSSTSSARRPATVEKRDRGVSLGFTQMDDPLGGAQRVSRQEAESFLEARSNAPPLVPSEFAVQESWIREEDGFVAFELADGPLVIYAPDARSGAEFVGDADRMGETEGSAWPFQLIPLRDTYAQVTDIHEAEQVSEGLQVGPGPAAVSWIEGGHLISILGGPPATASGVRLSGLVDLAKAMR